MHWLHDSSLQYFEELFRAVPDDFDASRFELFKETYPLYKNTIPFDPVAFAKDLGIDIFLTSDMDDDESGAIVRDEQGRYKVYINQKHGSNRRMFTLAHELAHFFCDRDYLEQKGEIIENEMQTKKKFLMRAEKPVMDSDLVWREVRANRFAAELLMPREKFLQAWEDSTSPEEVAAIFKVSPHSVKVRADNLLGVIF